MNRLQDLINFIAGHRQEILVQTGEHLGLTGISLLLAIVIGLPIGIALTRYKRLSTPILGIIGVVQTIPSVALLGFLLPLMGIGATPAVVALFLYALLPIVRNTFTGISDIDPAILEAATGMGMSNRQRLTKVELPLATPVIFAGIRTATVINVGVATLCALIGSGGLGKFIFRGIALNNIDMILAGAIPAALLALSLDFVLGAVQKHIRKIIRLLLPLSIIIFAVIGISTYLYYSPSAFKAGFTAEFMERSDGYPRFTEHYGFSMDTVELDPALMYQALKEEKVDVIGGFSTDGRIRAFGFCVLEDDLHYFPPYYAVPVVRGATLRRYPVLVDIFARIENAISNDTMADLNFQVDHHHKEPRTVAKEFLQSIGLRVSCVRDGAPDIIVGAKNFTEQYLLAEIFALLIENYSNLNVELQPGLGGTQICFDALRGGQIDIYPEYTGTGLLVILKTDAEQCRRMAGEVQKVYEFVQEESRKAYDIEWLSPLGFNNTYALIMRESQAQKLKISTITDLKNYLTGE